MNWKYLAVSTIFVVCFFLFLASVWHDFVSNDAILILDEIVVTPDNSH